MSAAGRSAPRSESVSNLITGGAPPPSARALGGDSSANVRRQAREVKPLIVNAREVGVCPAGATAEVVQRNREDSPRRMHPAPHLLQSSPN